MCTSKNKIFQTCGDFPKYATPDDATIARMLHLPPYRNKLHLEHNVHEGREHTVEFKIDNRTVYDIINQNCKDTDLYPYVKQHKSKRDG